jgi:hypothetical protein
MPNPDEARAMKIPAHVPNILRRGDVAKVLGLKSEQVAYFTRRKRLPVIREERYSNWWYAYRPEDIADYAESRQIVPNWNALKE